MTTTIVVRNGKCDVCGKEDEGLAVAIRVLPLFLAVPIHVHFETFICEKCLSAQFRKLSPGA